MVEADRIFGVPRCVNDTNCVPLNVELSHSREIGNIHDPGSGPFRKAGITAGVITVGMGIHYVVKFQALPGKVVADILHGSSVHRHGA